MTVFIYQDRRFQTLTHSSVFNSSVFCEFAANLLHFGFELLHFGARWEGTSHRNVAKSFEKMRSRGPDRGYRESDG
jgi:hypothetical protein